MKMYKKTGERIFVPKEIFGRRVPSARFFSGKLVVVDVFQGDI